MPAWGSQLFDNDATQTAIHDLLEAPEPRKVIQEVMVLAKAEPGELDDAELAGLLAAAGAVDYIVYGTEYPSHAEGLSRLEQRLGASDVAEYEGPLSELLAKALADDTLADFFADPDTTADFREYHTTVEALRQRLSPEHHGTQATA